MISIIAMLAGQRVAISVAISCEKSATVAKIASSFILIMPKRSWSFAMTSKIQFAGAVTADSSTARVMMKHITWKRATFHLTSMK